MDKNRVNRPSDNDIQWKENFKNSLNKLKNRFTPFSEELISVLNYFTEKVHFTRYINIQDNPWENISN